ncbi:MAG: FtsX-like permease family protein [Candidatus Aminicenantes bacterium]|nr:FtsX-like permease family protein [Candidatus Aminicenantes bacterium]
MIKRSLKHGAQTLRIASRALGRNKMRSFLTALGIIIGVGAVIAMVSIGEGAKRGIESRFAAMGTNLLFVSPGSMSQRGVHGGWGSMTTLKENDAFAILQECPSVMYISPSVSARAQTVYGNKNWNTSISGTGERYPEVRNWEIEFGAYFDEAMVKSAAKVCVLGADVKTNLFEDEDPIGKVIRVKKIPFKVLGVLKKRGESGGFGSRDDMITIPYTTAMRRLQGIDYIQSIDVRAVSSEEMSQAVAQIQEVLRNRHRIAPGAEDDFTVRNMSEIAETAAEATQMMTVLLGSIASISLLVGGIGIMNIMLVSVTERIREIGLRMAVGAREVDILLQFLTEAIVLSLLGGLIGIGFGVGASKLIKRIKMFSQFNTVVSMESVLLAFFFAAAIGIFFGFYPARKASRLDPIEALRYE